MLRLVALGLACILAASCLGAASPSAAAAPAAAQQDEVLIVPPDAVLPVPPNERSSVQDWYIVTLRDDAPGPGQMADQFARAHGLLLSHVYRFGFKGFAAKIPLPVVKAVRRNPLVLSVEPDQILELAVQNVPEGIRRVEAAPAIKNGTAKIDGIDGQVGVERVRADVAVIDSGIDRFHPDLNYVSGVNCYSEQPYPGGSHDPGVDEAAHGTHVAGIIGALDDNRGVVGVAPGARLWSVKVTDQLGFTTLRTLICGVQHVTANADRYEVANISIAGYRRDADDGNCGRSVNDALHRAVCASVAAGVTYVAAAGNECANAANYYPAAYDEVITVSAMVDTDGQPGGAGPAGRTSACAPATSDQDDTFADFSNWVPDIDLAAPGVDVYSTVPGGDYDPTYDGTSMAAPHVAGAAALYLAAHPGATPALVRQALIADREVVALPGDDQDNADEGVLNVNDGLPWTDRTPPAAPALTLSEAEPDEHARGTTLYYNPATGHGGSFTVAAVTRDPETGILYVAFPDVFRSGTVTDPTEPFATTYTWTESDRESGAKTVRAVNNNGLSSTATFAVEPDLAEPTAVIEAPLEGATIGNGQVVRVDARDPGGAGVAEVEVRWCRGTGCAWEDGRAIGSDGTAPYAVPWDNQPADGIYTLLAQATDYVGNRGRPVRIVVQVSNGGAADLSTRAPVERPVGAPAATTPKAPRRERAPVRDRDRVVRDADNCPVSAGRSRADAAGDGTDDASPPTEQTSCKTGKGKPVKERVRGKGAP